MLSFNFTPFPVLRTDKLLLRQMTLADAFGVYELRSNEEIMQYINRLLTKTVEEAENWIRIILEALAKNEGITWCIALKDKPDDHVGSIGLWRIEKENHRAEIGYMLHPALQGKSIMYEAIQKYWNMVF